MLFTFQIYRINLNWMTLADIALLHNKFNLSITRLAISYIKHNIVMLRGLDSLTKILILATFERRLAYLRKMKLA